MRVFRVLLLEDNAETADIVLRLLETHNIDVTHAPDGRTAMVKVKNARFDLILCDVMMPGIDGWRFLERASEAIGQTPVIMTTALNDRENVVKGVNFQVAGYLVKPIQYDALMEKVTRALGVGGSDIIRKRDFPFRMRFESAGPVLSIFFSGIPDADSGVKFSGLIEKEAGRKPTECEIDIAREFAYSLKSIDFLDHCVSAIGRHLSIKPQQILLSGKFLKTTVAVEGLPQSRVLGHCRKV